MKLLEQITVFDQGKRSQSQLWKEVEATVTNAITQMVNPKGQDKFVIRAKKTFDIDKNGNKVKCDKRNGVTYIKKLFCDNLLASNKQWNTEVCITDKQNTWQVGKADFVKINISDARENVIVEWETGNISSSHRSLNKIALAIYKGYFAIGILVVPSRNLYKHLTDRVGNIDELRPYIELWALVGKSIKKGLLKIFVVEHDELMEDSSVAYLSRGGDGNAKKAPIIITPVDNQNRKSSSL